MKKVLAIALILLSFSLNAQSLSGYGTGGQPGVEDGVVKLPAVSESVIENGLSVFILEDFSSPLVRVEFVVKAGFSDQTAQNSGFFSLYAKLFADSLQYPLQSAECLSDATHYIVELSPSELPLFLTNLSTVACNPRFTDGQIKVALSAMKKQVLENAAAPEALINQAIDSRVFADSPWKHDSGVYPSLFSSTTVAQARTYLTSISQSFYLPQNAAIFISGNIQAGEVMEQIENSFGRYYGGSQPVMQKNVPVQSELRKFVIHSPDFSTDYLQLVYQWTGLSPVEADMAAALYNNDYSTWKYSIAGDQKILSVGEEYMNAASAWKNGSSRFIVQALLQTGVSPCDQAKGFLEDSRSSFESVSMEEYQNALGGLYSSFLRKTRSSAVFMETLASYWVRKVKSGDASPTVADYFLRDFADHISVTPDGFVEKLETEEPFVFVLMNSGEFEKSRKVFEKNGFEQITSKNASWWNQKLAVELGKTDEKPITMNVSTETYWEKFYNENKAAVSEFTLKNGIRGVHRKTGASLSSVLIKLDGGEFASAGDPGFEEVMVNLLCSAVTQEIYRKQMAAVVGGEFAIHSVTLPRYSYIFISCETRDLPQVVRCFSDALIYSDILPSQADRVVQARKTKKRLQNGSVVNQLYCAGLGKLYESFGRGTPKEKAWFSQLKQIYETESEILTDTTYEKILTGYPKLLSSARYEIFVEGDVPANEVKLIFDGALGNLQGGKVDGGVCADESPVVPVPAKFEHVTPVVHTFLTDVSARDAGPRPAVLVPTKEFSDPVLYFLIPHPQSAASRLCLVDALAFYFGERLQKMADSMDLGFTVNVTASSDPFKFALITTSNVEATDQLDRMMQELYETVMRELSSARDFERVLQEIKNAYVRNKFSASETHLTFMADTPGACDYLEDYKKVLTADEADFYMELTETFEFQKIFRVYSQSSRK